VELWEKEKARDAAEQAHFFEQKKVK